MYEIIVQCKSEIKIFDQCPLVISYLPLILFILYDGQVTYMCQQKGGHVDIGTKTTNVGKC